MLAGVIKALNPFADFEGRHRSFLEIHLSKTKQTHTQYSCTPPHIFATSRLTHSAIESALKANQNYGYQGGIYLSSGRSIGQRYIPMERDLRFLWEETSQERLDENKQKVQNAVRTSLINWAKENGEGSDYVDNLAGNALVHWDIGMNFQICSEMGL